MRKHKYILVASSVLALSACDDYNDDRGKGDSPVGEQHEAPRQVWNNIDKFPNIVAWCIGANGVYTQNRETPPVVIAQDKNCEEGGILFKESSAQE